MDLPRNIILINWYILKYIPLFYDAIRREKAIKNLLRKKKNILVNKNNPDWVDLYPKILSGSSVDEPLQNDRNESNYQHHCGY